MKLEMDNVIFVLLSFAILIVYYIEPSFIPLFVFASISYGLILLLFGEKKEVKH